ncbi:hypothetical protein [Xanthomonas sp. WHRI 8932A]|uniref:hypothetical protein n=1 Tax=unclassified Xanthomonas TaxID=2643310 RepID=UPI002B227333|nr:hypothetical protein [Xanthomonas sp. WHRI 8932A]MEA9566562.1 hypothetical protein [Xanthomonas sp. WHRI 8932A]
MRHSGSFIGLRVAGKRTCMQAAGAQRDCRSDARNKHLAATEFDRVIGIERDE